MLGLTFKEDVPDIRNSRVPDIIAELRGFGIEPLVHDPVADGDSVRKELGLELTRFDSLGKLDLVILAVPHANFVAEPERISAAGAGRYPDGREVRDRSQHGARVAEILVPVAT